MVQRTTKSGPAKAVDPRGQRKPKPSHRKKIARFLGFTGTRRGLRPKQHAALRNLLTSLYKQGKFTHARHGDCIGGDSEFHDLLRAEFRNVEIHVHPALVSNDLRGNRYGSATYGSKPPLERNRIMVDQVRFMVACVSGNYYGRSGTWYTASYAHSKGLKVYIIYPTGETVLWSRQTTPPSSTKGYGKK